MATLSQVQLLDMAREVLHVCADHNLQEIIEDLTISRSAEATINRIFDGQFLRKSTPESESDLPNPSELFRSLSPEPPRLVSPRSRTAASRSRTTPTPAPKPTPAKSSSSVVVILSSDEEDNNTKAGKLKDFDDDSDDDGFDQLMKSINLIKKGEAATSKRTNGASSSGSSSTVKAESLSLGSRRRTALSPPPLVVDHGRSLSTVRAPLSPPTAAKPSPRKARAVSPTATWANGLKPRSADTTPTETTAGARAAEFTDKMPLSYEICSEWDAPLLPESPSPPPKPTRTAPSTPTAARNRSRSPIFKARSLSPTPPYSPSKREWALSRSPSPGFMLRLSNNESPHVGASSSYTSTSKYRSPSPPSIRRQGSSTHDKKMSSLPTEDDLLPRTRDREFNATSPVSRYSDETWLKRVKAEKQTDRARNALSERESFLIRDDDSGDEDVFGVKKEEFKRTTVRTTAARTTNIFDDDDDDDYKVKKDEFARSTRKTTTARVTDIFDDAGSNDWSKYESLVDDTLSPPRTFQDDDDTDPLQALDADSDVWSKDKKRSRNNAGLPQSPATKDIKKSKLTPVAPMKRGTKSGAGGSSLSSSASIPGIDHFDLSALDEYRDDPIVLDDDGTADESVEQELVRRRTRQQRQRNGKTKDDSDLEFDDKNSDKEDGSDTGVPKKRSAKGKANTAAKAKRELEKAAKDAEKAENEAKRLLKIAEKAKAKAEKDAQKEIDKYEREAKAAERKALSLAKKKEQEKSKQERAEEKQAKADDADAAKQAEREFRISNRLMSKSESVKEIILCIEESMFDSELGKALQVYLKSVDCRTDLLKSPVNGAIAVAAAAAAANAAAASTSRSMREMTMVSESTSLSELNGTNDACPVRDMIFWRRIITARMDDQGNNFPLPEDEHTVELESHWLCYMTAKEFCKKIEQNELHKFLDSVSKDMRTRMSRQKAMQEAMGLTPPPNDDRARRQRVILMIMGLTDHFRGLKNMTTRQFQDAVRARIDAGNGVGSGDLGGIARSSAEGVSGPKQERVERVLLDLQLEEDCLIMLTEDLEESAQVIVSLTEQLSQRPYKTGRNTGVNVCVDGIRSGVDIKDTWIKSLQQIHMVTPNMAEGIADEYPTIRALYEGYRRCSNVYAAQGMLEGVQVHNKKIGRVISKRVYEVFMGEDPDAGIS
ncbi:MAG: hypothetical protein J3R72DRAFT_149551 [Linnemannia gamsii]|nr:MAG: hypothetical protein J3R72DRAFT_149551 [Linnemannia gamsii]